MLSKIRWWNRKQAIEYLATALYSRFLQVICRFSKLSSSIKSIEEDGVCSQSCRVLLFGVNVLLSPISLFFSVQFFTIFFIVFFLEQSDDMLHLFILFYIYFDFLVCKFDASLMSNQGSHMLFYIIFQGWYIDSYFFSPNF